MEETSTTRHMPYSGLSRCPKRSETSSNLRKKKKKRRKEKKEEEKDSFGVYLFG